MKIVDEHVRGAIGIRRRQTGGSAGEYRKCSRGVQRNEIDLVFERSIMLLQGRELRGELDIPTAAMSKYWLTNQLGIVVDRCLQLFGGYGYMTEYPISQLYIGARVLRILAGSNEVMKDLIARSL